MHVSSLFPTDRLSVGLSVFYNTLMAPRSAGSHRCQDGGAGLAVGWLVTRHCLRFMLCFSLLLPYIKNVIFFRADAIFQAL